MTQTQSTTEFEFKWNTQGRAYAKKITERLTTFYQDRSVKVDLQVKDPRTQNEATKVLELLVQANQSGQAKQFHQRFDRAQVPFLPLIAELENTPLLMAVLDGDSLFVRHGASWEEGIVWRLTEDIAKPLEGVVAIGTSADHTKIVVCDGTSIEVREGFDGKVLNRLDLPSWQLQIPSGIAKALKEKWSLDKNWDIEQLAVSNDGLRVLFTGYRQGVFAASMRPGNGAWRSLSESTAAPFNFEVDEDDYDEDGKYAPPQSDMFHGALSPDGRWAAVGSQDHGHYVFDLDKAFALEGEPDQRLEKAWTAYWEPASEYPHNASFSHDSQFVAFNACHLYNGATIIVPTPKESPTKRIEQAQEAEPIDTNLRVYASTWLPAGAMDNDACVVMHGAGLIRAVTHTGRLLMAQTITASGGAMDFDPRTGRLVVGGYSGMLHILDATSVSDGSGGEEGYNPRAEVGRWLFWPSISAAPLFW
jgi:hypothetical protein